jgi:hypothetical protein
MQFVAGDFPLVNENEDKDALCPICICHIRDPYQPASRCFFSDKNTVSLTTCPHTFCRSCLLQARRAGTGFRCPICRETSPDILPAPPSEKNRLANVKVYCRARDKGCGKIGPLHQMRKHDKVCAKLREKCEQCGERVSIGDLSHACPTPCLESSPALQEASELADRTIGIIRDARDTIFRMEASVAALRKELNQPLPTNIKGFLVGLSALERMYLPVRLSERDKRAPPPAPRRPRRRVDRSRSPAPRRVLELPVRRSARLEGR